MPAVPCDKEEAKQRTSTPNTSQPKGIPSADPFRAWSSAPDNDERELADLEDREQKVHQLKAERDALSQNRTRSAALVEEKRKLAKEKRHQIKNSEEILLQYENESKVCIL